MELDLDAVPILYKFLRTSKNPPSEQWREESRSLFTFAKIT